MANEPAGKAPATTTPADPDPRLKQPEKSHMHSKDAHPAGEAAKDSPKKPT